MRVLARSTTAGRIAFDAARNIRRDTLKRMEASTLSSVAELAQSQNGWETVNIREDILLKFLDLLELASRRGAFEIEEFQDVHAVYTAARECLPSHQKQRR